MRLNDLNPHWIRYDNHIETWDVVDGDPDTWRARGCPVVSFTGPREYETEVESLAAAQGIQFDCPKCLKAHRCAVTFSDRGALNSQGSQDAEGKPSRWLVSGSGFDDLTARPSIFLKDSCGWHGFITNGIIVHS